jgi:hypothetical protein
MHQKLSVTQERREAPRLKAFVEGWADPGGVAPAIPCRVLDVSRSGAKVEYFGAELPDMFILVIGGAQHPAEVVWRRQNQVGVAFRVPSPVIHDGEQGNLISRAPSRSPE